MGFETGASMNFDPAVSNNTNSFWLPDVFSKKVQVAYRKASVAEAITNTDYYGEISQFGDTVNIIKEPQISTSAYTRHATLSSTDLTDEELVLTIDQAKYFQFVVDDLEKRFSHVNWQTIAADNAGYKLKDDMDSNVLTAMFSGVASANVLGADDANAADSNFDGTGPIDLLGSDGTGVDPVDVMARMARVLDDANVPEENRWFVAKPEFYEQLAKTNSKLMSVDYNQGEGGLRNGLVASGQVRGFQMYKSNNIPTTTNATGQCLAGHISSTATATALSTVETVRSTTSFEDIVRGLMVWGRKVLRDDALVKAIYTID